MKLLLVGYYGYGNIGDEALLEALINNLKPRSDIEFSVLSYNVEKTESEHSVKAISRGRHWELIKAIRKADAVVFGGGSVLQDVTSSLSLYYYWAILFLAKIFRKKTFLLGNGYGPVNKAYNRFLLQLLLPHLSGVIARDRESYEAYKKLNVKRLVEGVDLVYLLSNGLEHIDNQVAKNVVISLRPWHNSKNTTAVFEKTIRYLQDLGYQVKLLAMKSPEDEESLKPLLLDGVQLIEHDYASTFTALAEADFVIGMRLHALILAANLNTPFIAISYDPKVDSFNQQINCLATLDSQTLEFEQLKNSIGEMIDNLAAHKKRVAETTVSNKVLAEKQMKRFLFWLDE